LPVKIIDSSTLTVSNGCQIKYKAYKNGSFSSNILPSTKEACLKDKSRILSDGFKKVKYFTITPNKEIRLIDKN
jgi:hypothetical protein